MMLHLCNPLNCIVDRKHAADPVSPDDLWSGLTCQHQYFFTVAIDMELAGADYSRKVWIVLHSHP